MRYRVSFFVFVLFCSFLRAQPADGSGAALCDQIEGQTAREQCRMFYRALERGDLITPDSGAVVLFEKMAGNDLRPALRDTLRRGLSQTLWRKARAAVDTIVAAQPDPVLETIVTATFLDPARQYLEAAAEWLPEGDSLLPVVLRDQWYLEGVALRRLAARSRPLDTTLLRQAINHQLLALDVDYQAAHPFYEIGRCFYLARDYNQSALFYLQAAERDPGWAGPMVGLSRCQYYLGEGDQGLQLAAQAVEAHPGFHYAYLNLAQLLGRAEQPILSQQVVEKMVKKLLDAPPTAYTREQLARILTVFELYAEAEPFLLDARLERPTLQNTLLLGDLYDRAGYVLAADSVYRDCIARWPSDPEAYLRQGLIYHGLAKYAVAKQYYEEVLLRAPDDPETCYNLALIESLYENEEAAASLFERARAHDDRIYQVWDTLREIASGVQAGTDVLEVLPKAESYFQPHPFFGQFRRPARPYEDRIYLSLGDRAFEQGRRAAAVRYYQTALLFNPGQRPVYPRLIRLLLETGDYQQAYLFTQLYDAYVEPSRDNRDERRFLRDVARETRRLGARRLSYAQLDYYFYVLDNFWYYLHRFRDLTLEPDALNRQLGERTLRKLIKR